MQVADSGPGNDAAGSAEARARARQGRKRIAVAAEALANAADVRIVDVPKSDAVFALLGAPCHRYRACFRVLVWWTLEEKAVDGNLLFEMLSAPSS